MKVEKPEKIVGYVLLVIGLIFIALAATLAYLLFSSGAEIPQFVPVPADGENGFAKAFAAFSNVCLIFFVFIVIVWAGSIISSRGVTLIKEIKLKIVKGSLGEEVEVLEEEKTKKT